MLKSGSVGAQIKIELVGPSCMGNQVKNCDLAKAVSLTDFVKVCRPVNAFNCQEDQSVRLDAINYCGE